MRVDVPLDKLSGDPDNARGTHYSVSDLVESIRVYGLLQNLVVIEDPAKPGHYIVRAGNRRLRALIILAKEGHPISEDGTVSCLCLSGRGEFEAIAENIHRSDISPWKMGHRYCELIAAGKNQTDIANAIGKSQGHVSCYVRIAEGLHPKTIARLERLDGASVPSLSKLMQLAAITDDLEQPDPALQGDKLDAFLGMAARKVPRKKSEAGVVLTRFRLLKDAKASVPTSMRPYVDRIVEYLDGTRKRITPP